LDLETGGEIKLKENEQNFYKLFQLSKPAIESLNFTISKNGERIFLKKAYFLWITYFLIFTNSFIFWARM